MRRKREDHERDVTLAWFSAMFTRQERMPRLDAVLGRLRAQASRLTAAAQHTQLALLSEHVGVPLRPISPEAVAALERLRQRQEREQGHG